MYWNKANGLLTESEIKLFEIAKDLMDKDERLALTGSLMMAVCGINKRREATDIDFIYRCEFAGNYKKPEEAVNAGVSSDGCGCCFTYNGIKVDIMSSGEDCIDINGVLCGSYNELLKAKFMYSTQNNDSAQKHKLDLMHLGVYTHLENMRTDALSIDDEMPF